MSPAGSIPLKVHMSDTNPHVRLGLVHFKVIDAASTPQTWVLTIKLWEQELGDETGVKIMGNWLWMERIQWRWLDLGRKMSHRIRHLWCRKVWLWIGIRQWRRGEGW